MPLENKKKKAIEQAIERLSEIIIMQLKHENKQEA